MEEIQKLKPKSKLAEREEEILKFWQEQRIFEQTLSKPSPKGEFVFYEGPPTANGLPGIHHLEARGFKDAIPRYKTMQGFFVRRKGGWDTHGLPVELAVEKELGLKSKKEIEEYGIAKFNQKCRESVWKHVDEWKRFTNRIGFWLNLDNPYITYEASYVESLWAILKKVHERKLLYKDYKVVPWCPRCGTGLSSHELAQGYETVKDLSLTVRFKIQDSRFKEDTYLLAWTTTPWTLPGNVALAINPKILYALVLSDNERYIVGRERVAAVFKDRSYEILEEFLGEKLVGLEYEPLYPFLKDSLPDAEKEKLKKAFKVYPADFVTTTDGTGIVHTAVMYGADDFELGTKVGLPRKHLVNEDGTFKKETDFLAGKFVKDESVAVDIIKDLAHRGLLFAKEKHEHSYPHCWRCKTPLIYYARDSWYIAMSKLRDELVSENQKINWEPSHIKNGRFGEWLADVKDWAISRERYWGTPLPVWQCEVCKKYEVVGSYDEIRLRSKGILTRLFLVRHGKSEKNVKNILSSSVNGYPLTAEGRKETVASAKLFAHEKVDAVYSSPILRAKQTAEIFAGHGSSTEVIFDERLREVESGAWEEKRFDEPTVLKEQDVYKKQTPEGFYVTLRGGNGESWKDVEDRMVLFLKDILQKHKGETVMLVSHEGPLAMLQRYLRSSPMSEINDVFRKGLVGGYAFPRQVFVDSVTGKEFNPHRPRIDDCVLTCDCGGEMRRVKEVVDVWFDSGAMPFAQDADKRGWKETRINADGEDTAYDFWKNISYPADFISEAIDQTRGWFYTLHAVGVLLGKGLAYKNVICLGHILDAEGKKMSKSVGNVVDPNLMIEKYGADALRLFMYSVNQPGESKNFDEKTVEEGVKKVLNRLDNVLAFYQLYANDKTQKFSIFPPAEDWHWRAGNFQFSKKLNVLDLWIIARLNQLILEVTKGLDEYKLLEPTRAIRDFVDDLSVWYLRRSRERIKNGGEDGRESLATLGFVLCELSKIMAPFTPFFAEFLYKEINGEKESVHLESWPEADSRLKIQDSSIIQEMEEVRKIVSLALEARAKANIKVRQPLSSLKLKSKILNLKSDFLVLIADEVNVKQVEFDGAIEGEVLLDANITPELKEEGDTRDLIRAIQEFRKEQKLNPNERANLVVKTGASGKDFLRKHEKEIATATTVASFVFEDNVSGKEISAGGFSFVFKIKP